MSVSETDDTSFNTTMIRLYSYFFSSFYFSSPGHVSSTLPLFPIAVTGLWIESSIQTHSYTFSPLLSTFLHKFCPSSCSHSLSELISTLTQKFSVSHYFMSLQDIETKSLPWNHSLSDCTYLPLFHSTRQEIVSQKKRIIFDKSYFLISPQFSNTFKDQMKEVVR